MIQLNPSGNPDAQQNSSLPVAKTIRSVLFVCQCNVCRSPAAQIVFQTFLERYSVQDRFYVDSAGILIEPDRPPRRLRSVSTKRGYRLPSKPRRILRTDLNRFDLVVAMDEWTLFALNGLHSNPKSEIRLIRDFLDCRSDVPDPINRSVAVCEEVFDLLESACPQIAKRLCRKRKKRSAAAQPKSSSVGRHASSPSRPK